MVGADTEDRGTIFPELSWSGMDDAGLRTEAGDTGMEDGRDEGVREEGVNGLEEDGEEGVNGLEGGVACSEK